MKKQMMAAALVGAMAMSYSARAAGWFAAGTESEPLNAAHAAFLSGNYLEMTSALRQVFESKESDEYARNNAFDLLATAYEKNGGQVPANWELPLGLESLKLTIRRGQGPTSEAFALKIGGETRIKGLLKQIQVVRFPSEIVLDKQQGGGTYIEQAEDGGYHFELEGKRTGEPAPEGLYLVNLETNTGKITNGWFILSDLVASETPTIRSPHVGQVFTTRNPLVRWEDFKSPEYKPFEYRAQWVGIMRTDLSEDYNEVWARYEGDPSTTEVTVGVTGGGVGVTSLVDGEYRAYVTYKENRGFGPMRLGRQAVSHVPFRVKGK